MLLPDLYEENSFYIRSTINDYLIPPYSQVSLEKKIHALLAVKKGAFMLVEVFLMLGVLIPMVLGKLLFGETIRLNQWIGMGILVAATLVMCSYNNSQKQKLTAAALILSMGMSALFFKEKMTPKGILGIVLAFTGLLVMNVL